MFLKLTNHNKCPIVVTSKRVKPTVSGPTCQSLSCFSQANCVQFAAKLSAFCSNHTRSSLHRAVLTQPSHATFLQQQASQTLSPFAFVSPSQNNYFSKNMPSVPPLEFQTLLVMLTTSRKSTFCIQFSLLSEENLSATPQPPWGSSPRHTEMLLKTCVFPGWEVAHPLNNTSTTFRGSQGLQPRAGEGIE